MLKLFTSKGSNSILVKVIPISNFHTNNPAIQFVVEEGKTLQSPQIKEPKSTTKQNEFSRKPSSGIWPEWVNLMDKLFKTGYFEGVGNPAEMVDANQIRTACLNFARHRFHLIRLQI